MLVQLSLTMWSNLEPKYMIEISYLKVNFVWNNKSI
jgi:hypothetical protein